MFCTKHFGPYTRHATGDLWYCAKCGLIAQGERKKLMTAYVFEGICECWGDKEISPKAPYKCGVCTTPLRGYKYECSCGTVFTHDFSHPSWCPLDPTCWECTKKIELPCDHYPESIAKVIATRGVINPPARRITYEELMREMS